VDSDQARQIIVLHRNPSLRLATKGTNGRWMDVVSAEEIAKADEIAAQNLTPDCAHCLKTGGLPAYIDCKDSR